MQSLAQRYKKLQRWLSDRLPTSRRTTFDVRVMPRLEAGDLDVDRAHEIISAAKSGDLSGLFALYLEMIMTGSHLQGRFVERKEAVLSDSLSCQPVDKKNRDDVIAAAAVADLIESCQDWEKSLAHLLDSILYPVSLVEKTFTPSSRRLVVPGGPAVQLSYALAELTPVPYELLDFTSGRLLLREVDGQGQPTSATFEPARSRYIIHRGHLLGAPDNFGGPMRSLIFWWLLGHMGRDWWARYLERYGAPFIVGKYDQADDATRSILQSAFSVATKLWGLVVSRETEIELVEASAAGTGEAFDRWKTVCNEEISKLIGGQTLSADAKATGMGSGVAKNQGEVRADKRKSDARRLSACLRFELCAQYLAINGLKGRVPRLVWAADTPDEAKSTGESLSALAQANLEPADSALPVISEKMGFEVQRAPAPEVGPLKAFSAPQLRLQRDQATAANEAVVRAAAAELAPAMRTVHAPIVQLIARSATPQEAVARVEAYCAALDPLEAAEIIERTLAAMAANGCAVAAR